jgi:hypothetical protein
MIDRLRISAGPFGFTAQLETGMASLTCAEFRSLFPYRRKLTHARLSGETCWIPLGDFRPGVPPERPGRAQLLSYPGGISETEILLPYGNPTFACKDGPLEGTPSFTIVEGQDRLPGPGRLVLWGGAQDVVFEAAP